MGRVQFPWSASKRKVVGSIPAGSAIYGVFVSPVYAGMFRLVDRFPSVAPTVDVAQLVGHQIVILGRASSSLVIHPPCFRSLTVKPLIRIQDLQVQILSEAPFPLPPYLNRIESVASNHVVGGSSPSGGATLP